MDQIRILLDRHFPYGTSALQNAKTKIKEVKPKTSLPSAIARIHHVLDLYYQSFSADVVMGNRRTALLLGLLYQLYKPKKVSLIGYEIIFNFKNNFKNKLVKLVWRTAVKKIDKLVVMTNSERSYLAREFHTSPEKFNTINFYAENADYIGPNQEGYIFAAGRMERDFETLLLALKDTNYPAIIVADVSQKEKLEKIKPENVQIHYSIPREKYNELLRKAKMVVVPLYKGAASRGQVVILEAMRFGKPVVCTKVDGTVDYLTHGQEGFFVAPQKPEAMRKIFDSHFNNEKELETIGKQAYTTQRAKFSPEVFRHRYLQLIRDEYQKKNNFSFAPQPIGTINRKEGKKKQMASS